VRVVAGDGTGDRELAASLPGVAAEWRPGAAANALAVATPDHDVRVIDVDRRRVLWSSGPAGNPRELSWSGDGRRLLVRGAHELRVLDGRSGRAVQRVPLATGETAVSAVFAPRGRRIALVRRGHGVSELVLLDGGRERLLFAGAGSLGDVTWSPDGRWLLVGWPTADEFLFAGTSSPPRVQAVLRVAQEFHPRAGSAAAAAPSPAGWCCSR
jgi:dipeptidyl aminopeptidase/acylaminoacyl peptidase